MVINQCNIERDGSQKMFNQQSLERRHTQKLKYIGDPKTVTSQTSSSPEFKWSKAVQLANVTLLKCNVL